MDTIIVKPLINFLQSLPVEIASLILFIFCVIAILGLFKLFGENGIHIYSLVAVLAANIQVLKLVKFNFYQSPVALGTIVFASTYLCSGLLNEHYGARSAQNNLWYCLAGQILMTCLMLFTIGHKPLLVNFARHASSQYKHYDNAITLIFTPLPRLLLSSILSFMISQKFGIWIFRIIKFLLQQKYLWFTSLITLVSSTFLDTFLFNTLAWKILADHPMNLSQIFYTYMVFTLITQLIISVCCSPIIGFSYKFKHKLL